MNKVGANGECTKTEFGKSDYITHHGDFVKAVKGMIAYSKYEGDCSYWKKQLDTLTRLKEDYHN